jgi:hypothetical protein
MVFFQVFFMAANGRRYEKIKKDERHMSFVYFMVIHLGKNDRIADISNLAHLDQKPSSQTEQSLDQLLRR